MESEQLVSGDDDGSIPLPTDKMMSLPSMFVSTLTFTFSLLRPLVVVPLRLLWNAVHALLTPVLVLLRLVALPFVTLSRGVLRVMGLPLVVIKKFEAILTFLLVACLVGAIAGALLHFSLRFLHQILGIDSKSDLLRRQRKPSSLRIRSSEDEAIAEPARTVADFRAARKVRKRSVVPPRSPREERLQETILRNLSGNDRSLYSPGLPDYDDPQKLGLASQTILEEDDSSESFA